MWFTSGGEVLSAQSRPRKQEHGRQGRSWAIGLLGVAVSVLLSGTGVAQAETVLVPIMMAAPIPGGCGATWQTEFSVWNASDWWWYGVGANYFGEMVSIAPHSTMTDLITSTDGHSGLLLVPPDEVAAQARFQLRLRDTQSTESSVGVEIPVLRSRDFIHGSSALLGVPGDPSIRRTFRIYNLDAARAARFTLKAYTMWGEEPEFEYRFEIRRPSPEGFSMVRLDDGVPLPILVNVNYKFELVPDDPFMPYWWFASLVENSTNAVTIVAPH